MTISFLKANGTESVAQAEALTPQKDHPYFTADADVTQSMCLPTVQLILSSYYAT